MPKIDFANLKNKLKESYKNISLKASLKKWSLAFLKSLAYPFTRRLSFLLALTFIRFSFVILYEIKKGHLNFEPFFIILATNYVLALISGWLLKWKWPRRIYDGLIIFLATVIAICEFGIIASFGRYLCADDISIMCQTDVEEMGDFFSTFMKWWIYLIPFIYIGIICLVWWGGRVLTRKIHWRKKGIIITTTAMLGLNVYAIASDQYFEVDIQPFIRFFRSLFIVPDLHTTERVVYPEQVIEGAKPPRTIIYVIGESFDRKHASLYGYDKTTTPRLDKLAATDPGFIAFTDVTSASTFTADAFIWMLTDIVDPEDLDKDWINAAMLPTTMRNAGVRTYYIASTQQKGLFDKIPTRFGELCDSMVFVADPFKNCLDSKVLPPIKEILTEADSDSLTRLIIVSTRGQHFNFTNRYPADRKKFYPTDYPDLNDEQAKTIAEYDNSILYTDEVLARLINIMKGHDAMLFFVSDHGQDMYVSDPTYFGHANTWDEVSVEAGTQVPLLLYFSPTLRENNPGLLDAAKAHKDDRVVPKSLVYTFLDLIGWNVDEHGGVQVRSIFRGDMTRALCPCSLLETINDKEDANN